MKGRLAITARTPSDARPPRMEALARLPVFFALGGQRAVVAGGSAAAPGRPSCFRRAARRSRCSRPSRRRRCSPAPAGRRARPSPFTVATGSRADLAGAAIAVGGCEDDAEAARFAAAARAAGVPVNVDRQAGVLRLQLRRDRQPLAAGHRHLDRRRRAGIRPGDPRQARGADPARLCALGARRRGTGARRVQTLGACRSMPGAGSGSCFTDRAVAQSG